MNAASMLHVRRTWLIVYGSYDACTADMGHRSCHAIHSLALSRVSRADDDHFGTQHEPMNNMFYGCRASYVHLTPPPSTVSLKQQNRHSGNGKRLWARYLMLRCSDDALASIGIGSRSLQPHIFTRWKDADGVSASPHCLTDLVSDRLAVRALNLGTSQQRAATESSASFSVSCKSSRHAYGETSRSRNVIQWNATIAICIAGQPRLLDMFRQSHISL